MKKELGLITALLLVAALTVPLFNTSPALAADTGWINATNNTAQDGDGFEVTPEYAYLNGPPGAAENINGGGDSHRYYGYGFSIPAGSTIDGIEVRLDWWLDSVTGYNYIWVKLSWDGGTSWTSEKQYTGEPLVDPEGTVTVGGAADNWGHAWTLSELSNPNFRVLVGCYAAEAVRDFYFDWIAAKVYYTPHETICDDLQDNDGDGDIDCDDSDCLIDADKDGYNATCCGTDCDDNNPDINPGASENCTDGIDNDCDEYTDCADDDCESFCASIGDTVFYDNNNNGTQDAGEGGIANVEVRLYKDDGDGVFDIEETDELVDSKTTDAGGAYLFPDLLPFCDQGYWVLVVESTLPPDVKLTTGSNPIGPICLGEGEAYDGADFGYLGRVRPPVGGEAYPVNKLAILAPWIALGAAIIAGAGLLVLRRRRLMRLPRR